jgi:hypothetical protein
VSRIHDIESRRISLVERSPQAFAHVVFTCMCVGEYVPHSSGDADEGSQWGVHTNEGWVPYWDSYA